MKIVGKAKPADLLSFDDLRVGNTYRVHHSDYDVADVWMFTDEGGLVDLQEGVEYLLEGRHSDGVLRMEAKYEQVYFNLVEM